MIGGAVPVSHAASGIVVGVVLAAAVCHAGWNLLAKAMDDQVVAFWTMNAAAVVCGVALLGAAASPAPSAWPYLAVSVALHVGYNTTLLGSYRLGELSQVYPLARGMAPLLVTAGAAVFAGEHLGPGRLAGVAIVAGGLVSLVSLGGRGDDRSPDGGDGVPSGDVLAQRPRQGVGDRRAVALAVGTGILIAAYSLVDGLGVRSSGSPLGYAGVLFTLESTLMVVGLAAWRRHLLPGRPRATWALGAGAGVLSVATYGAVLWAQTRLALGLVSALRETSVVAAALLGAFVLHEGSGWRRVLAAGVVCAGVAVLVGT
jgi:drug/metabolite transporter (DMT)-like permease